jgi:hypothetical protein
VLATFCWTKLLLCNVAAFTRMLLYPESTLQLCSSRRFCEVLKQVYFGSLSAVRTTWSPIRMFISQQHPSGRRGIPSGRCAIKSGRPDRPSIIRREVSVPACIRLDVSAARPDASQYSIKLQILSKFFYGKIDATVRTTWILVRTRFSLRQELQFKFNRPDSSLPSSGRACI